MGEVVEERVIVLRRAKYSETSLLLTLFGERMGKMRAVARGAFRRGETQMAVLDLFAVARVGLRLSARSHLHTVTEVELERAFLPRREDGHGSFLAASYFAALVEGSVMEGGVEPGVFGLLERALGWLSEHEPTVGAVERFEARLAEELGIGEGKRGGLEYLEEYAKVPRELRNELLKALKG